MSILNDKITLEEMAELFGNEPMPIEAVELLMNPPEEATMADIREQLKQMRDKEMAGKVPLCGCGDSNEAVAAAIKLTNQMIESDCPVWAMQVLVAGGQIAKLLACGMSRAPVNHQEVKETLAAVNMNYASVITLDDDLREQLTELMAGVIEKSAEEGIPDKGLDEQMNMKLDPKTLDEVFEKVMRDLQA